MTMSVGRDYRSCDKYEYCIYENEKIIARQGLYKSYSAAKRAGLKKAAELAAVAA